MDKDVMNFYYIYKNISFDEKLENAHRKLVEAHDAQSVVILSSLQALAFWKEKLIKEQDKVEEIVQGESAEIEGDLKDKASKLERLADEIHSHCETLIPSSSALLLDKTREFEAALDIYQQTKEELQAETENVFDEAITKQFQEWRLDEIEQLRKRIQDKAKKESDVKLAKYLETRKQQLQECETIAELQEKITATRIALSRYPLEARQRLQEYDDKLFQQRESLKILQKQVKFAQKGIDGSLSRSTSRRTSKDTQRTKASGDGMKRRQTIYEQIFKGEKKRFEKQETGSSTTADDE